MFNDLEPYLTDAKARDLLNRVEHRGRVEQALPGEIELALLWGLSQLGRLDVESPDGGPDAVSGALIPGQSAAVEITAPNDNELSGEAAMDAIAQVFCGFASKVKRKAGDYLYFRFGEKSGYEQGQYYRRRLAPHGYRMSEDAQAHFSAWVTNATAGERFRIAEHGLDVEIESKTHKQTRYHNIWCSMPAGESYSLTDNPLFKLLNRKRDQFASVPAGVARLIFLGDAGSTLLRHIGGIEFDPMRRRVSGSDIIHHFLRRYGSQIDGVVTFAPHRVSIQGRPIWRIVAFSRSGLSLDLAPFHKIGGLLPRPRLEGYQTRSLYRQKGFHYEGRGSWLPTTISWKQGDSVKYKISGRALLDLLAGRATPDQFRYVTGELGLRKQQNIFRDLLDKGQTISKASLEPAGTDEDDDYIVLEFSDDAAARKIKLRSQMGPNNPHGSDQQ